MSERDFAPYGHIGERDSIRRSTMMEYDLQLFFIKYAVQGTTITSVEIYEPKMDSVPLVQAANFSTGDINLKNIMMTMLTWTRVYHQHIEERFREAYTAKATLRRIR